MIADTHEIDQLADDFLKEAEALDARVIPIVENAARRVRDRARENAAGQPSLPHYPASITYSVDHSAGGVGADIGPDKDLPQGALGDIIEDGSVNNPPQHNIARASAAEEDRFELELADAVRVP